MLIIGLEIFYNICIVLNSNTTTIGTGFHLRLVLNIFAQDSEIGSVVEPMVWVYIEDIDRLKMIMMIIVVQQ